MDENHAPTTGGRMSEMKIGFELRKIRLSLENILPVRQIKDPQKNVRRYKTILVSLKEVGLVEPLVVHPQKDAPKKYLLLDGHLRLFALKELGETSADCIIANDDECFTYNARISRLPPIQEHKMITRAVRNGVKPERIAAALNMPVRIVIASMRLLDGIREEAADLLKDKNVSAKAICLMKRVSGVRQIEIAEMMVNYNNFYTGYAEALVLGTPKDQLVNPDEPKQKEGISPEDVAKMEQEMESLERDLKAVEETYGENMLVLTVARGYIKKLLENAKVVRFLNGNFQDILAEFESIAAAESL
ncbi:MAG: ParB N-terminal domain-containing protein [Verrucomicrobiota bacterium]|nr:ParB N-terminal domain-containing protein [Verrucomicrobiota bacterium]